MIPMKTPHPHQSAGVTIIEMMVAMVIGMMLMAVIASVLATSEGSKRSQTGVNDISQAGNYAAFILDQWIRAAGSGFNQTAARSYGCPLAASKSGAAILPLPSSLPAPFAGVSTTVRLAPIIIVPDATTPNVSGNTSDALMIMEGAAGGAESYTTLTAVPTASSLTVKNTLGYVGDDLILLVDQLTSSSNTATCLIEQVTTGFSSVTTALPLSGTYYGSSTTLTGMTDSAVISNLGNVTNSNPPRFMIVGVGDNNVLYSYDLLQTNTSPLSAVAEGVFEMHAIYGVDTNADSKVDTWAPASSGSYAYSVLTNGTSTSAGLLQNIKAIRLGLILRSPLKERLDSASKPTTGTPDSFTFFSGYCSSCAVTRTFTAAEKQFRYRKIEVTIPLRNNLVL
jgi:type IV pilus assembly protein PilW